ncbi:hypothetical protein FRB95_009112 [Tulasnella sp. JGI-2019a]|nr:hypothetical protein FRB95_009112 [Tulasnella sp. JGI-2019a]
MAHPVELPQNLPHLNSATARLQSARIPLCPGSSLEDGCVRINLEGLESYATAEHLAVASDLSGSVSNAFDDAFVAGSSMTNDHPSRSQVFTSYLNHSNAPRVRTDTFLTDILRAANPGSSVVATRDYNVKIFGLPDATITPLSKNEIHSHVFFAPPAQRGQPGKLTRDIQFGAFTVKWGLENFLMYTAQFDEGFGGIQQYWFVHNDETTIGRLITAIAEHANKLHEEILLFAHGYWQKSHELWVDVQKANWEDVILDSVFKKRVQDDINGFFANEKIYKDLAIPWKRGIIFLGPPGNGKTISIKAIMKSCPHPVLVVKNFTSFMGDEMSMQIAFAEARRMAPCLMVLEDLDSLITDQNRSFFLNEMDGLSGNNGLLIIGTTNYFSKLDPALSKRPSRFDRKFEFLAPNKAERGLYLRYWQKKLKDNKDITFPDRLVDELVSLTDGFSFAYLKEAMVSTLVTLAGNPDLTFEDIVKEQIKSLRKSIDDGNEE